MVQRLKPADERGCTPMSAPLIGVHRRFHYLVSGAKPRTPKGPSRTAQGASPGFKVQIAESPERAPQGARSQLQINARHKARLSCRDPLHRPFEAYVLLVLVPRACALGFPESLLPFEFRA